MKKGIFEFAYDTYYGALFGAFTAPIDEVNKMYGTSLHYGEVLGKHSDVTVTITPDNLTLVSDDMSKVIMFDNTFPGEIGYNPYLYWLEVKGEDEG